MVLARELVGPGLALQHPQEAKRRWQRPGLTAPTRGPSRNRPVPGSPAREGEASPAARLPPAHGAGGAARRHGGGAGRQAGPASRAAAAAAGAGRGREAAPVPPADKQGGCGPRHGGSGKSGPGGGGRTAEPGQAAGRAGEARWGLPGLRRGPAASPAAAVAPPGPARPARGVSSAWPRLPLRLLMSSDRHGQGCTGGKLNANCREPQSGAFLFAPRSVFASRVSHRGSFTASSLQYI